MGSVPDQYAYIFGLLESEKYLTTELVKIKDREHDKFVAIKDFDKNLFDSEELNTLKEVLKRFKDVSTPELMKISHNEKAWQNNIKGKTIIDYLTYAPQLMAL
jgi:uncharacterized phage-associated protein